jgi:hypothetical protein
LFVFVAQQVLGEATAVDNPRIMSMMAEPPCSLTLPKSCSVRPEHLGPAGFQELDPDVAVRRITLSDNTFNAFAGYVRYAQLVVLGVSRRSDHSEARAYAIHRLAPTTNVPVPLAKR